LDEIDLSDFVYIEFEKCDHNAKKEKKNQYLTNFYKFISSYLFHISITWDRG